MVPVDHFLFPRVKAELAAISVMQETFQMTWDWVLRTIAKEYLLAALLRWYERHKMSFWMRGGFINKYSEIMFFVK
jgi:hypothetical protein